MVKQSTMQKKSLLRALRAPFEVLTALLSDNPLLRNRKLLVKSLVLGAVLFLGNAAGLNAQNIQDCAGNNGCTDPANSGYFSTSAASLSYDNVISTFHSSAAYAQDGTIKVWGEASRPVNITNGGGSNSNHGNWFGTPTTINAFNGFTFDAGAGQPLKIALGSKYAKTGANTQGAQFILLTTGGHFYAWGFQGIVLSTSLTPSSGEAIQRVRTAGGGGSNLSLPAGVNPTDVKMLFATSGTLAMTTCAGEVYVLSQNLEIRQNGSATAWVKIQKAGGGDLTGIVATRGTSEGLFALDNQGDLWTWGYGTRLGGTTQPAQAGQGLATRRPATKMNLPSGATGNIKMIAATKGFSSTNPNFDAADISYFVLYDSGELWAMGENSSRELGDWSTTNRDNWVRPTRTNSSSTPMNNIAWISTQEHDGIFGFVNVVTKDKTLWNWGRESGSDLGRSDVGATSNGENSDPGMPDLWETGNSNTGVLFVESGGHTTMLLQECKNTFGYVGHYRYGSMGDNRAGNTSDGDRRIRFTTAPLPVCGVETTPATLTVALSTANNEYCNSSEIQLVGAPAGGIYRILEVDASNSNFQGLKFTDEDNDSPTGLLDLSAFNIPTNGSRTVRLGYVIPEGQSCAGDVVQLLITIKACIVYNIEISGKIWIDVNEDAIDDSGESNLANSARWANLVDANGDVIRSVLVDATTGEYTITASQSALTSTGDYTIILTTNERGPGTPLSTGASAPTGYKYTGTNRSDGDNPVTTGNTSEKSGILSLGDLSSYSTITANTTLDDANFGVKGNITISGNVWHDTDGNAEKGGSEKPITGDTGDDNSDASSDTDSDIWANLVDEDGNVVQSVQVGNDGTYEFPGVEPGDYKVILTDEEQPEGDPLSVGATIPGWVNTGTHDPVNNSGDPDPSNKTNIIDLGTVTSNIANVNFGLQQPPVSDDSEYTIEQPTSGDEIPLDGTVISIGTGTPPVAPPIGSDPDGTGTPAEPKPSIVITKLPYVPPGQEGNEAPVLYYDGNPVIEGEEIEDFDPSKFSIVLGGTGYTEVSFDFKVVDAAGSESEESTYTLLWQGSLPVKWQAINVTEELGVAVVSWSTTEELNVSSYEVQYSPDVKNWRAIGTVKADNAPRASYSFTHKLSGNSAHYFRIQSKDLDGSTSLSRIVSLQGRTSNGSVYPNPVLAGELVLDLAVSGSAKAKVYSAAGIEVLNTTLRSNVLNVRNLSSGHYILQVTGENGEIITRSFIVK